MPAAHLKVYSLADEVSAENVHLGLYRITLQTIDYKALVISRE